MGETFKAELNASEENAVITVHNEASKTTITKVVNYEGLKKIRLELSQNLDYINADLLRLQTEKTNITNQLKSIDSLLDTI